MSKTCKILGIKVIEPRPYDSILKRKITFENKSEKSQYRKWVVKGILTENNTLPADAVIVIQETIAAVKQLFDIQMTTKWLVELMNNTKSVVCTFIGVGIRKKFPGHTLPVWTLNEPIKYAGKTVSEIAFHNYSDYDEYAPEGCSALTTFLMGNTYDFWKKAKEEGLYEQEKQVLANQVSRELYRKYPQFEGYIDVIDIATPLTYECYTGTYHGSWMSEMRAREKMKFYPGFLKEISGLYFAGHRLMQSGGLPVALNTGRKAVQMVCRQFNVIFK